MHLQRLGKKQLNFPLEVSHLQAPQVRKNSLPLHFDTVAPAPAPTRPNGAIADATEAAFFLLGALAEPLKNHSQDQTTRVLQR